MNEVYVWSGLYHTRTTGLAAPPVAEGSLDDDRKRAAISRA